MSGNPYAQLVAADFEAAAQNMLPRGRAWPREPGTLQQQLTAAMAGRLAALHAAATELSELESDPRYTVILLPLWEAAFGLPDPCLPATATIQQRQNALVARINGASGQSENYYISLAASLGFPITIDNYQPFVAGYSSAGQPLLGEYSNNVWQVNSLSGASFTQFTAGRSVAGEPLFAEQNAVLECVFNREKPAQSQVIFNYGD